MESDDPVEVARSLGWIRARRCYALTPRTRQDFAVCLQESGDLTVPLPARAARAGCGLELREYQ
ncbi:hypothetical protein [Herbidospora yilanensis]|uniref:hypothetical protein n=1 Tax=Herbidospora yilanensis TaxID=354426 RepID=UPI0007865C0A|nr:hypothetical protein [Herbidospora yilanensis]